MALCTGCGTGCSSGCLGCSSTCSTSCSGCAGGCSSGCQSCTGCEGGCSSQCSGSCTAYSGTVATKVNVKNSTVKGVRNVFIKDNGQVRIPQQISVKSSGNLKNL